MRQCHWALLLAAGLPEVSGYTRFWINYTHSYEQDLQFARVCYTGCLKAAGPKLTEQHSHECWGQCTARSYAGGRRIFKLSGLWYFKRLQLGPFSLVEPASCLLSAAHIPVTLLGIGRLWRAPPAERAVWCWSQYLGVMCAGLVAWILSALHHGSHLGWATQLDYFGALLYLSALASTAVGRALRLRTGLVFGGGLAGWGLRCCSMQLWGFEYGSNMALCVCLLAVHTAGWCWVARSHPNGRAIVGLTVGLAGCGLLEIFDFPPWWGVLDAHSLWHSSTPAVTLLWQLLVVEKDLRLLAKSKQI